MNANKDRIVSVHTTEMNVFISIMVHKQNPWSVDNSVEQQLNSCSTMQSLLFIYRGMVEWNGTGIKNWTCGLWIGIK